MALERAKAEIRALRLELAKRHVSRLRDRLRDEQRVLTKMASAGMAHQAAVGFHLIHEENVREKEIARLQDDIVWTTSRMKVLQRGDLSREEVVEIARLRAATREAAQQMRQLQVGRPVVLSPCRPVSVVLVFRVAGESHILLPFQSKAPDSALSPAGNTATTKPERAFPNEASRSFVRVAAPVPCVWCACLFLFLPSFLF